MKVLSIDPGSNRYATSTSGVVLCKNALIVDYWAVGGGKKGIIDFLERSTFAPNVVIFEKYEVRAGDSSADNSVLETIDGIEQVCPDAIAVRNAGFKSEINNDLLKRLGYYKFDKSSHHEDIREAYRLMLFWANRTKNKEILDSLYKKAKEVIEWS